MTTISTRITRATKRINPKENPSFQIKNNEELTAAAPPNKSIKASNKDRSALEDISNRNNRKRKLEKKSIVHSTPINQDEIDLSTSPTSSPTPSPTSTAASTVTLTPLCSPEFPLPPIPLPIYSEAEAAAAIKEWASLPPTDYSDGIFGYLYESELISLPSAQYMDEIQGDLSHPMRSILIDWLVEVSEEYKLQSQTFYLAVSYLDRFLSQVAIDRSRLQLVGITCMLTAAKYWEIYPPCVEDFVYISDHTYSRTQLLEMESALLTTLQFRLAIPTCWEFARRLTRAAKLNEKLESMVDYILELFTQSSRSLHYVPSLIGASAVFLALHNLPTDSSSSSYVLWPAPLPQLSHYSPMDMKACLIDMSGMLIRAWHENGLINITQGIKAVKLKYANEKRFGVSKIKPRIE